MEFKVFKNENSKILKEYWLTPSEWDALDKTTVQEGDIYHIVGTIDKGDLSADVNASLAKGDSSLQKPTATLAKESFVKVGIDGTQKFDESSYVIAPSTGGTAGQVLKKTATGTEWADESGGGVDTLEAKLNENIIKDPSKTYLVWKGNQFPNSTDATFKASAGCTIDWGDGNVETFEVASTTVNTHTYSDGIEYHLISITDSATTLAESAFFACRELISISLSNNLTSIGQSAFRGCNGVTSLMIPSSVKSIGVYTFDACSGLTSITIPDSVTLINWYAFDFCRALTSVTIGSGISNIGDNAFSSCDKLKTVRISATTPPTLGSGAFETSIEKIIVPKSAINAYKAKSGWSTYADKIVYEVDSSDLTGVTVVQGLGYSTTAVMSQEAVTNIYDELRYAPNATKILYYGDFSKTVGTAISCRFYWGDGTFTDYTNAVEFSHIYSDQVLLHTISIVGLTSIPDSMFVDDTELYEITFGVGVSADMSCFANCTNLKTIRIQDNDENVVPITTNDMSVFTYNFDYVNFRIVVPRRLYVKILENNTNISTEFIWNFVVPDDSYVCSHSIQLSGSNNSTYEVMLYSTCKLPLNQVPLATDPSTGTDKKRDILRELIDGEIAYKYSGDSMDGFGSLIYSDSDNQYHLAFCGGFGATKTDETFDLTEIISDIVKLK